MASFVWFSVLVLTITIQLTFARNCAVVEKILNCDDCTRCGGYWCNNRDVGPRCSSKTYDDSWCPDQIEPLHTIGEQREAGKFVDPLTSYRSMRVLREDYNHIRYTSDKVQEVKISLINSTQSKDLYITSNENVCEGGSCTVTIEVKPKNSFCYDNGTSTETVYLKVKIATVPEEVTLKYLVPCGCKCSERVEFNSDKCYNKGHYSCGDCDYQGKWSGDFHDKCYKRTNRRGDLQCTNPAKSDVDCSGNGQCVNDICLCDKDKEGSQYFEEDFCGDICMRINDNCESCLQNATGGVAKTHVCNECENGLTFHVYNESLIEERDFINRRVWARCNETLDGCYIEYVAMRDSDCGTHVMVIRDCTPVAEKIVGVSVVPLILGVLAALAVLAAVGGFMMYKNMGGIPPVPLNDAQIEEPDGEDHVGVNPLYKPPSSFYRNPLYGSNKC